MKRWEPEDPEAVLRLYRREVPLDDLAAVAGTRRATLRAWLARCGEPVRSRQRSGITTKFTEERRAVIDSLLGIGWADWRIARAVGVWQPRIAAYRRERAAESRRAA